MPEELWTEVRGIVEEVGIKTIPKKKKCKKAKWLPQIAVKRRDAKGKGENGAIQGLRLLPSSELTILVIWSLEPPQKVTEYVENVPEGLWPG